MEVVPYKSVSRKPTKIQKIPKTDRPPETLRSCFGQIILETCIKLSTVQGGTSTRYCGKSPPAYIESLGELLEIEFHTNQVQFFITSPNFRSVQTTPDIIHSVHRGEGGNPQTPSLVPCFQLIY